MVISVLLGIILIGVIVFYTRKIKKLKEAFEVERGLIKIDAKKAIII